MVIHTEISVWQEGENRTFAGGLFFLCTGYRYHHTAFPDMSKKKSVLVSAARCNIYNFYMEILICGGYAVAVQFKMLSNNEPVSPKPL